MSSKNCALVPVDPDEVTDAEMAGFGWVTFKENVALALAVATHAGVPPHQALRGMYAAPPDPGVLRVERRWFGATPGIEVADSRPDQLTDSRRLRPGDLVLDGTGYYARHLRVIRRL